MYTSILHGLTLAQLDCLVVSNLNTRSSRIRSSHLHPESWELFLHGYRNNELFLLKYTRDHISISFGDSYGNQVFYRELLKLVSVKNHAGNPPVKKVKQ